MVLASMSLVAALELAKALMSQAQSGRFDRSELAPALSAQLTQAQAAHFTSTVGRLGKPSSFVLESKTAKGSYTKYTYRVSFSEGTVDEQIVVDASNKVAGLWFAPAPVAAAPGDAAAMTLAKSLLRQAQAGHFDRSRLTSQLGSTFSAGTVAQIKDQVAPLGNPTAFTLESRTKDATGTTYYYRVAFAGTGIYEELTLDANGKVAGLWFKPAR